MKTILAVLWYYLLFYMTKECFDAHYAPHTVWLAVIEVMVMGGCLYKFFTVLIPLFNKLPAFWEALWTKTQK